MDVVHPSSDMRTAPVPPRPVSREGAVIAPSASSAPFDVPSRPQQNIPWSPTDVPPVTVEAPSQAAGDWPDPIDFTSASSDEAPKTVSEPAGVDDMTRPSQEQPADDDVDINQIADAINKTLGQDQDAQAPLESPFLMDAKVEKRPLGAFSTQATVSQVGVEQNELPPLPIEPATPPLDDNGETQDEPPIETDTPLPAELQDDLLLIESGVETAAEPKKDEPITPQKPQVEVPAGPTSITQQYTEQPSTGDQPTGAIFDTEAYQKPLAHPAKKKSGWLMLLWVALLLIGGAGAGAAVYFFVLPK